MPQKRKSETSAATKQAHESKTSVKLYVGREHAEQKKRQLQSIQDMQETHDHLKQIPEDSIEVGQRLKAIVNSVENSFNESLHNKESEVLSEEQIEVILSDAKKSCDDAAVAMKEIDKTLEESKKLIDLCTVTSGSM